MSQLDFSDVAHQLDALKEGIYHAIATHEAKIQCLKQAVAEGRYEVQSHQVARQLLDYTGMLTTPETV